MGHAALTREKFFPLEDKLRMFKLTCNFCVSKITLILQWPKLRNDVNNIFISEHVKNMSFVSRMYFHMKSTSGVFYSKTLISV